MTDSESQRILFRPIRRIVTGHDKDGKSVVKSDGEALNHKGAQAERRSTLLWATKDLPADFLDEEDAGSWELGTAPPEGGTRFCIIETGPGVSHALPHRTDTIDYVICLSGEITMDLDEGTVVMQAGDVLIQMGTNHRWRNESNELASVAFVLVDGKPKSASHLPVARL